jgi:hypothetical protein
VEDLSVLLLMWVVFCIRGVVVVERLDNANVEDWNFFGRTLEMEATLVRPRQAC